MILAVGIKVMLHCGWVALVENEENNQLHLRLPNNDLLRYTLNGKVHSGGHPEVDRMDIYNFYNNSMDVYKIIEIPLSLLE